MQSTSTERCQQGDFPQSLLILDPVNAKAIARRNYFVFRFMIKFYIVNSVTKCSKYFDKAKINKVHYRNHPDDSFKPIHTSNWRTRIIFMLSRCFSLRTYLLCLFMAAEDFKPLSLCSGTLDLYNIISGLTSSTEYLCVHLCWSWENPFGICEAICA